jgi:hypothetical protein
MKYKLPVDVVRTLCKCFQHFSAVKEADCIQHCYDNENLLGLMEEIDRLVIEATGEEAYLHECLFEKVDG